MINNLIRIFKKIKKKFIKITYYFWEIIIINEIVQIIPSHTIRQKMYKLGGMKIGKDVSIFRKCYLQNLKKITIGNNCIIGFYCRLDGRGGLKIGENVNISSYTILESGSHDFITFSAKFSPITISDNVWVGTRSTILQGVTVGEGAIIAAGSVVTRDVNPFEIVAGVPAAKIGLRPKEIDYLLTNKPLFH